MNGSNHPYERCVRSMPPTLQMVRWCIGDLSERLDKAVWKQHPGAQAAFCWMVFQVSFPDLSGFLPEFLPFSLRFVDDWETGNKGRDSGSCI